MGSSSMTKTSNPNQQFMAALALAAIVVATVDCGRGLLTTVDDGGVLTGTDGSGSGGAEAGGITGAGDSTSMGDADGTVAQAADGAERPRWQKIPETPVLEARGLRKPRTVFMDDRITVLTFWDSSNGEGNVRNETWSYQFAQNDWVKVSQGPMCDCGANSYPGTVWTGTRLFYWDGWVGTLPALKGGLYDPVTDAWSPISLDGAPALVVDGSAYSGQEVFLSGRIDATDLMSVVFFNPSTDRWREAPSLGIPTAEMAAVVGVGGKIVVWGGVDATVNWTTMIGDGAVYDAARDRWTPMSPQSAPGPRVETIAFAARGQAFLWGGTDWKKDSLGNLTAFRDGAMYDPTRDLWTPISTADSPVRPVDGFWAEQQGLVYLWAGQDSPGASLWTYNPATDTWATFDIADLPALKQVSFHWTGSKLLVIGYVDGGTAEDAATSGLRLTGYLLNP